MNASAARLQPAGSCLALVALACALASGCGSVAQPAEEARASMAQATTAPKAPVVVPPQISDALQKPAAMDVEAAEPRFDLVVNNAQAREVFLAMVTDTRYSMLMHPEVAGTLSVTLKGVTIREALEAIRDVYGYDFKVEGRRITVFPPTLQTRIFNVNYLNVKREARSEIRVNSGASVVGSPTAPTSSTPGSVPSQAQPQSQQAFENSRMATTSKTDFWLDLAESLRGIVGTAAGRNVVVNAQAGVVAVRAMPDELREVESFLKAARLSVERQVMLEAKIVEVELRDGLQTGVDWQLLRGRGTGSVRSINPGTRFPTDQGSTQTLMPDGMPFPTPGFGLFSLVFNQTNFDGILSFLETQGNTQILSSPRIAALNNQRAVLKVGTDELFVTGVTGGTITPATTVNSGNVTTLPTITLSSFFSGIALDVMPQVDAGDTISLHIRPSVSSVTEVVKQIDLGGSVGSVKLPLPANSTNETDTVVRVTDGYIVAIGGLMQVQSQQSRSGVPGAVRVPWLSYLFGNTRETGSKKEIVVLIKPTIIRSAEDWREQARESRARMDEMADRVRNVITIDGSRPPPAPR